MAEQRERQSHWIRFNHQNRVPSRWVAFDTEARKQATPTGEIQTWLTGCAVKWRTDLKGGDCAEFASFHSPEDFWQWVTEFSRPKTRTVVFAHNLGYDVRISRAMDILPLIGWHLDWCNLGANVSTMTWRSDRGTLVFADLYSWLPMKLEDIGEMIGLPKKKMPAPSALVGAWNQYCMRDTEILYRAVSQLVTFVKAEDLGNWQPTGAGMAFATWRHKFLKHQVLVHDVQDALTAERKAMHTGRAEAWRHGKLLGDRWTEVDLRQAYVHIAASHELPTKLKWKEGALTLGQYRQLCRRFRVLARVDVRTSVPSVPTYSGGRTIWPVGQFSTWLWDCELDVALRDAERVDIREAYVYTRAPILAEWAQWVLDVQRRPEDVTPSVVKRYVKHSGRTLIGRIALRTAQWAVWGANPDGETGISHLVDSETGRVSRLMHVGDRTMVEEARVEGNDSLPQVTGWIMAMCRVWLWEGMEAAGFDNIAHVDTDSVLVNRKGLERMREYYGERFFDMWQTKSQHNQLTMYGPRNYRIDRYRKIAGIPVKAEETTHNTFVGESWASMAGDMAVGNTGSVTVHMREWTVAEKDPRRADARRGHTRTAPLMLGQMSKSSATVTPSGSDGS
jgi:hypothetical protein